MAEEEKQSEEMKVVGVLQIGVAENDKVIVNGQLEKKKLCLNVLAEAIKIVNNYEPSRIIKPNIAHRIKGAFGGNGGKVWTGRKR